MGQINFSKISIISMQCLTGLYTVSAFMECKFSALISRCVRTWDQPVPSVAKVQKAPAQRMPCGW